jgi:MarR family transcriptional regulator for hemolysin
MSHDPPESTAASAPSGDSLGRQIALTAKQVRAWADRVLTEHGASLVTWIVLQQALRAEAPGFSQRELAAGLSIGGPSLVRHLDRLEREGLVRREPDPDDRRVTRVSITEAGRLKHQELAVVAQRLDDELGSVLSGRERRVLIDVLVRIEAHAAQRNARPTPERRTEVA